MRRTAKKATVPGKKDKAFKGAKGKIGSLTFSDLGSLLKRLGTIKGALPPGFSRRGGQFCVTKKP